MRCEVVGFDYNVKYNDRLIRLIATIKESSILLIFGTAILKGFQFDAIKQNHHQHQREQTSECNERLLNNRNGIQLILDLDDPIGFENR